MFEVNLLFDECISLWNIKFILVYCISLDVNLAVNVYHEAAATVCQLNTANVDFRQELIYSTSPCIKIDKSHYSFL